jgi:uncharacterized protein (DUF305 family)
MNSKHYGRLALMAVLSFIAMYVLMYAMVDTFGNVYPNFNQFYMAGLMTAPMIVIEVALMGAMYENRKLNATIVAASLIAMIAFWFGIREQAAIADQQFLKSMIPHHAGAILMCGKASLQDVELKNLCNNIVSGQRTEIEEMKAKLKDHER